MTRPGPWANLTFCPNELFKISKFKFHMSLIQIPYVYTLIQGRTLAPERIWHFDQNNRSKFQGSNYTLPLAQIPYLLPLDTRTNCGPWAIFWFWDFGYMATWFLRVWFFGFWHLDIWLYGFGDFVVFGFGLIAIWLISINSSSGGSSGSGDGDGEFKLFTCP